MTSSQDTSIAAVALVVALVALLTTIGQLLQQYFATADGYRRCQPSVMGHWAKRTRLRWRWNQFRFETLFTTPEIVLYDLANVHRHKLDAVLITGSPESRDVTLTPQLMGRNKQLVSWINLLDELHETHATSLARLGYGGMFWNKEEVDTQTREMRPNPNLTLPGLTFQQRSWDFMPPDVVRPPASTSLHDIAVLARRLGMTWKQFSLADGTLRAEGNGFVITSTNVRSVGLVLHFTFIGNRSGLMTRTEDWTRISNGSMIPISAADCMGFGLLPGCTELWIPTFDIGTEEEVFDTLNRIDNTGNSASTLRRILESNPKATLGFSDLIPMAAPMIRRKYSTVIRVPMPTDFAAGLTYRQEGFVVFYHRLQAYIKTHGGIEGVSLQIKWILEAYQSLKAKYPEWEDDILAGQRTNDRGKAFLADLHAFWDATTGYFVELQRTYGTYPKKFRYYDLMCSHIRHAIRFYEDATTRIKMVKDGSTLGYGFLGWLKGCI
jgi:hypothetical protein